MSNIEKIAEHCRPVWEIGDKIDACAFDLDELFNTMQTLAAWADGQTFQQTASMLRTLSTVVDTIAQNLRNVSTEADELSHKTRLAIESEASPE